MTCKKPGVPPSSLSSMLSMYLCSPQGLVQETVPPPGLSGIKFWYNFLLKTNTPEVPGPPRNLCGEKNMASKKLSGSSGCMSISTYRQEQTKSTKQSLLFSCINFATS